MEIRRYSTKDFISASEHGMPTYEQAVALIRNLAVAADFHRSHHVLIDLRETEGSLSFTELLNLAMELVQYQQAFRNKLAVVIPDRVDRREKVEFFKEGVSLVGFQFEYFTDYEEAVKWVTVERDQS